MRRRTSKPCRGGRSPDRPLSRIHKETHGGKRSPDRPRARRAWATPLAAAWLLVLFCLPNHAAANDIIVLHRSGDLFVVDGDALNPVQGETIDEGATVQAGPAPEEAARGTVIQQPAGHVAALYFAPGQVVTLVSGATAARAGEDDHPAYTFTGAVHLLFDTKVEAPGDVSVNGVTLRTRRVHLFVDGWAEPPTAQVISGEAELAGEGESASPSGIRTAGRGQTIVLDPASPRIEGERLGAGEALPPDALRGWSTVAGYESPGPYRRVGEAMPTNQVLRINRNERISRIEGERMPVYEGDQLLSDDGQRVRVEFDSGDRVRLTNKTVFKIDEYLPENQEQPSMLFSLFGKVRALITSRVKAAQDAVRFKTDTATIGVKGTDFNLIAEESGTVVETVEGTVGVSDAAGAGEVLVGPGLQTSVAAGALPDPPSPIPPDRLQELQDDAITLAAAAATAATAAIAAPPPVEPPPPAEAPPVAEPAAPAEAVAAAPLPVGDPCVRLRGAWLNSIAAKTGDPLDERFLDLRGRYECADAPRAAGIEAAPADVPFHPERGPAAGMASKLDETYLNDLQ